jgi:hypothetical protein
MWLSLIDDPKSLGTYGLCEDVESFLSTQPPAHSRALRAATPHLRTQLLHITHAHQE